jgi:hypothetical protein
MRKNLKQFLMFILFASLANATDIDELRVRPYSKVTKTESVNLLDVVVADRLDSGVKEALQKVVLGDAPALGEKRVYSTKMIADALRKNVNYKQCCDRQHRLRS